MKQPNNMPRSRIDYDLLRTQLVNARIHFKLVFGLTATRPEVSYLTLFSFGSHPAPRSELALDKAEEEKGFSALEHCATYLAIVQIHTVLEQLHAPHHFSIPESEIADAFQIARLLRNAFAHNPFDPTWEIKGAWQGRVFDVPSIITLNTSLLNGQRVKREHYGGPLAILRFIAYAEQVIELRKLER